MFPHLGIKTHCCLIAGTVSCTRPSCSLLLTRSTPYLQNPRCQTLNMHTMSPPRYPVEDSQLIADLFSLSKKSRKLVSSTVYPAPGAPNTLVRSWKMNEYKYYQVPSPFPTLARGIFTIDVDDPQGPENTGAKTEGGGNYRIVARGYDKFFNIGEVPWTTWKALENHTTPPYTLSLKSNGCIIFIAALTPQKLLITSKHSLGPIQGVSLSHAQAGEEWLRKYLEKMGKTEMDLAKRLWDENWTAIAELCDDSFEEHVLAYPPERTGLHLHGLNVSTKAFQTMSHDIVDAFADEWGFIKTRTHIVNSIPEVKAFTDNIANVGQWEGEPVEGFVVRTHVCSPPTCCHNTKSSVEEKEKSPYSPGSSFFFKVKFDEPYMMYRDWREVTKMLLTQHSKGQLLSPTTLPKGKMRRSETKQYVKWVIGEIQRDKRMFDGYTKGHGIVSTRERFLTWFAEQGMKLGSGKEGLAEESAEEGKVSSGEQGAKVIIVPIAIPGCGKTSVALALAKLFGWGHTQNDNVKAKRAAPAFLSNIQKLLQKYDVVIADKNNHLRQHRIQLHDLASNFKPRARLIALNWSWDQPAMAHQICSERIISRGANHQSLIPSFVDPSVKSDHERVLWKFLNDYEELTPSEVDHFIDLELTRDSRLEDMVSATVDRLFEVRTLVGSGGVLEGVEKPDSAKIREAVQDILENYKANENGERRQTNEEKGEQPQKPPRYFGLIPDISVRKMIDGVFSGPGAQDPEKIAGAAFFQKLESAKRITEEPHITIVHQKALPAEQDVWDKSIAVTKFSHAIVFDCKIEAVVWDDRVMVLAVEDIRFGHSTAPKSTKKGEEVAKEFLEAFPNETKNRLHITVGTANGEIKPVEGKDLMERWREGGKEGIEYVSVDDVVVKAKLKGLWS